MKNILIGVIMIVLLVLAACSTQTAPPTPTVEEAIQLGYMREVEMCSNRLSFPDLYQGVPHVDLGNGMCEFYYPANDIP